MDQHRCAPPTARADDSDNGEEAQTERLFDTGILAPGQGSENNTINGDSGIYDYYCTLHPYMNRQLMIED